MRFHERFTRAALSFSSLVILGLPGAQAGSATWNLNPSSNDWNTATNWTPMTVPNGPSDTAFFGVSDTTDLSLSAATEVNGITFNAGASAYMITANPGLTLTISGTGITNSSGTTQEFLTTDHGNLLSSIIFTNSATAGNGNLFTNNATYGIAFTQFFDTSNAGTSIFINNAGAGDLSFGGATIFSDESSAGSSTIISNAPIGETLDSNGGTTFFEDNSTASNATLVGRGAGQGSDGTGEIQFFDQSTAANARIRLEAGGATLGASGGGMFFFDAATAGNAVVSVNGSVVGGNEGAFVSFSTSASAGNATFVLNGGAGTGPNAGGYVSFGGASSGGTATFRIFGNSIFTLNGHTGPGMSIGSIEGDGTVDLFESMLTVGTNNSSTTFSGVIEDQSSKGSLSKVGTGTLTLSGANTYGGGTTIEAGTLLAATTGKVSATGTGPVQVDAGILGGGGFISGAVTVGTGSGTGAFLAPAAGTTQHKTLRLQSSLTFQSDATYTVTFVAKADRVRADKVVANGVTINNATIAIEGTAQGTLTSGTVVTLINNTSANPINGTFNNLPDGAIVTVNGNNFEASYTGGDGNDLTLTVVP